jgi:hypothetical protein
MTERSEHPLDIGMASDRVDLPCLFEALFVFAVLESNGTAVRREPRPYGYPVIHVVPVANLKEVACCRRDDDLVKVLTYKLAGCHDIAERLVCTFTCKLLTRVTFKVMKSVSLSHGRQWQRQGYGRRAWMHSSPAVV